MIVALTFIASTLFEYLERRKRLQIPSEQSRLLENVPMVIPEPEYIPDDSEDGMRISKGSSKSILQRSSSVPNGGLEDNRISEEKLNHNCASPVEEKQHLAERSASREPVQSTSEKKEIKFEACHFKEMPKNCPQGTYIVQTMRKTQEVKTSEVINLVYDDEDENDMDSSCVTNQKPENLESSWYILDKTGEKKKYSLSLLKRWSETTPHAFKFKVWREDQKEENAVWLKDVLNTAFPKKSK
ncbi:uncharacterized protein Fot_27725 [Forsythia ovata]|uniref:Uncharacterized protein n=1 Tax=Forsythia ovata TaxID=205694 RepID=A0ABD1TLZ4_9LAMI